MMMMIDAGKVLHNEIGTAEIHENIQTSKFMQVLKLHASLQTMKSSKFFGISIEVISSTINACKFVNIQMCIVFGTAKYCESALLS